jgi:hypothetical protein
VVAGTGVKLYIGQAAYRTGNTDAKSPWYGVEEIRRQLAFNRAEANVSGYIMYAYKSFTDNPALYALIRELNAAGAAQSGGAAETPGTTDTGGANTGATEPGTTAPGAGATVAFSDIADHWAGEYILAAAKNGVVRGYPDGSFLPDNNIKRADFVLMLANLFGLSAEIGPTENFVDIAPDAYYYNALGSAKKLGVVTGIGDNMFDPDVPLSRQDMFSMAYRALVITGKMGESAAPAVLDGFTDRSQVAIYAVAPWLRLWKRAS